MPETIGPLALLLAAAAVGFGLGWKLRLSFLMRGAPVATAASISDLMGDGSRTEEPGEKKWRSEAADRRLDSLTLHFMLALGESDSDATVRWNKARELAVTYLRNESEASRKSPAFL